MAEEKDNAEELYSVTPKDEIEEHPLSDLPEEIRRVLCLHDEDELSKLIYSYPSADLAISMNNLEDDEIISVFVVCSDNAKLGDIFTYMNLDSKTVVCQALKGKKLSNILNTIPNDDLADYLEDIEKDLRNKVLSHLAGKKRVFILKLVRFSDDAIGSIMTTEYLSVRPETKISDVFRQIKERGSLYETVRTIFVTDSDNVLLGTESLEDMMFEDEDQRIDECMVTDYPYILPNADREEAIPICRQYDLPVLPVVTKHGVMVGIITFDDVLDVIEEENTEDVYKQAGVAPTDTPYMETPVFKAARSYVVWLIILLVINTFSGMVINDFENALLTFPHLLSFIPAKNDSVGNAGDQTTSMVTRALATGELKKGDYFKAVMKEFAAGLVIALISAVFAFLWVLLEMNTPLLNVTSEMEMNLTSMFGSLLNGQMVMAGIVSASLFFGIAVSKLLGAILPILAKAIHIDPAVMSGPLIASIMDIITLIVYFAIATAVISATGVTDVAGVSEAVSALL